ncbi:MAG: TIGR03013 family XrtA/PEP-CTERM system glycosyltransferase [Pontixanthobacter sp.]
MFRLFKHYIPNAVMLLALFDTALLLMASELALAVRASQIDSTVGPIADRAAQIAAFVAIVWTAMVSVGVYGNDALRSMRFACARLLVAISLAIVALSVLDFVIPGSTLWRSTLLYATGISVVLLVLNRLIIGGFLGTSAFRRRVLVLGAGERAKRLRALSEDPGCGYAIVSFVGMNEGEPVVAEAILRGAILDLGRFVGNIGASEVVLALEERRNSLPLKDLLRMKTMGVHINDFSSFVERETGRIDLDSVDPSWLIFSDGFSSSRAFSSAAKRGFDIVASVIVLLATLPIVAVFAVLVKLDSHGPALFRQSRVGLYGQDFVLLKLRSMRVDAEKDGAKWAEENDPRITRLGRFMRKVRIDELPQTWSVLKGEMSFVGPRPEVPHFVGDLEQKIPYYAERRMVKPGITGWAQINYPYGATTDDARQKLEYDPYYAKNYTPFLDLLILLQTLRMILWPEGAR